MKDCLFCKIINGEIPSYKIYENEFVYAFLDIADDFEGHTLVIPKKHYNSLIDCDKETINNVMQAVQIISKHYLDCGYDGINVFNNNGKSSGQAIEHLHFHIIPRKSSDSIELYASQEKKNCNFKELAEKLKLN